MAKLNKKPPTKLKKNTKKQQQKKTRKKIGGLQRGSSCKPEQKATEP